MLEETVSASSATTAKTFTYGTSLISTTQAVSGSSAPTTRYFLTDGGGSVRELADETGAITDRYDYDAFGDLTATSGTTDNAYLYRGEQYDGDLGLYYLRARYMNPDSGQFWNADTYEGANADPISLHRYLYAAGNPVTNRDPSGNFTLAEAGMTTAAVGILAQIAVPTLQHYGYVHSAARADGVSKISMGMLLMTSAVPAIAANPAFGYYVFSRGADYGSTGLMEIITGNPTATGGASLIGMSGVSDGDLALDAPIMIKALADVVVEVGPALKVKAIDAYYKLRNLCLKEASQAAETDMVNLAGRPDGVMT